MSREEQKQSKPAKKKAPKKQAASPQKQMTKRPNPRRPRGTGGKMAAEIVISVALVAFVGYQDFICTIRCSRSRREQRAWN